MKFPPLQYIAEGQFQNVLVSDLKMLKIYMKIADYQNLSTDQQDIWDKHVKDVMQTDLYKLVFPSS